MPPEYAIWSLDSPDARVIARLPMKCYIGQTITKVTHRGTRRLTIHQIATPPIVTAELTRRMLNIVSICCNLKT
jgi:hypothetical protein